jgi:hypothetical protein
MRGQRCVKLSSMSRSATNRLSSAVVAGSFVSKAIGPGLMNWFAPAAGNAETPNVPVSPVAARAGEQAAHSAMEQRVVTTTASVMLAAWRAGRSRSGIDSESPGSGCACARGLEAFRDTS